MVEMCEITIFEKRFVNMPETTIVVSFQISKGEWEILRRTKFWKKTEKFLKK